MKALFALIALLASLAGGAGVAAANEVERASVADFMTNTASIGQTVSVVNTLGQPLSFTATLGGSTTEPVIIPAGGTFTFTIPNDIALVGLTLTVRGRPLPNSFFKQLGIVKKWTITA